MAFSQNWLKMPTMEWELFYALTFSPMPLSHFLIFKATEQEKAFKENITKYKAHYTRSNFHQILAFNSL